VNTRGGYTISAETRAQQVDRIHAYLSRSYWAKDIPLATVARSVANSLCVGVFHAGEQVGFARVVTDRSTFAYLCDVYVLEDHRGKGLASWMLELIAAHPDLQGLRRFMLATRDAHALYKRHGFTPVKRPESLMEILNPAFFQRPTE
jgi:GNAT superfamily N-acetyltransferase